MKQVSYEFMSKIIHILNSGQSKSIALTGNVNDLFFSPSQDSSDGEYTPLLEFLLAKWMQTSHYIKIVCEFNKPVQILDQGDIKLLREAWQKFHVGVSENFLKIKRMVSKLSEDEERILEGDFDKRFADTAIAPSMALEFLRQLCMVSRAKIEGKPILEKDLVIIIDGAHMFVPQGEISRLSEGDRSRVAVLRDWFSDPDFTNANDSVVMITESRSSLNEEVSRLPQLLEVEISSPGTEERKAFIAWFFAQQRKAEKPEPKLWGSQGELATQTAGLSIQALMQLLRGCVYLEGKLQPEDVVVKVEQYIRSQLGDVVEFKKPKHRLSDVVGNEKLKIFLREKFMPRVRKRGKGSISGAAVAGPNRAGKSFIFEAVATELGIVVLVLKNLRSMWFGQTDVIFGRLKRILIALDKVLIFMDEADTQMGGVGKDTHSTERRLTGNIQNMMSDPQFRGKVIWLLITARIQLLSVDLRQPGRAGDMIIPVLDPDEKAHKEFVKWVVKDFVEGEPSESLLAEVTELTLGYSAGAFDFIRREFAAESEDEKGRESKLSEEEILRIVSDLIMPDFEKERRVQSLYALLNCTRRSLLPKFPKDCESVSDARGAWREEVIRIERELVMASV